MSTLFREPEPVSDKPTKEPEENKYGYDEVGVEELRPVEDERDILEALGIADDIKILPEEDRQDLRELKDYLASYMEEKGLSQTLGGLRKGIESLKEDVGLHKDADPQAVIKKIGGIARSWKELSFVRDVDERKKILIKLIGATTPKEMDRIIFQEMEARSVWRQ